MIIDLYLAGKSPAAIAKELSLQPRYVYSSIYVSRSAGKIPSVQMRIPTDRKQRSGVKLLRFHLGKGRHNAIGCLYDIIDSLTPAQIRWLVDSTPDGAKIAETVAAIITDTFFDEITK
jgi:hypothetical protein